jgi:hypothetical protein
MSVRVREAFICATIFGVVGMSGVLMLATARAQGPCTHVMKPCVTFYSLFGECCMNAGGFQTGQLPRDYESTGCKYVNDPAQCGARFEFLAPFYPCSRWIGYCGGTACSPDCN